MEVLLAHLLRRPKAVRYPMALIILNLIKQEKIHQKEQLILKAIALVIQVITLAVGQMKVLAKVHLLAEQRVALKLKARMSPLIKANPPLKTKVAT